MAVFNLQTGMIGTVASVASARSFTLTGKAPGNGRAQILISAYGGCGPADYYRGSLTARSGKPPAILAELHLGYPECDCLAQ